MELIKDRYTIDEVAELLSGDDPVKKKQFHDDLINKYYRELFELALTLKPNSARETTAYGEALLKFTVSRDEILRYDQNLRKNAASIKPKKKSRGRPRSRVQREAEIKDKLGPYRGKKYPRETVMEKVAEQLEMNVKTLKRNRHYKNLFEEWKGGCEKS